MFEVDPPVVQVAIDVQTIDEALQIAEAAASAGVDWLEAGTPLITFAGTKAIGALAGSFPELPVLADYKTMDGAGRYVAEAAHQGAKLATVCAVASDATVRAAVSAGKKHGVAIVADLYAAQDAGQRAAELEALGVDSVYVHWGADQRAEDPARDPLRDLPAVLDAVRLPVGVGTFSVEDGARGARLGASILVIGVPLIRCSDVETALREYVTRVREAWNPSVL